MPFGIGMAAVGIFLQLVALLTAAGGSVSSMRDAIGFAAMGGGLRTVGLAVAGVAALRQGIPAHDQPHVRAAWILVGGILVAVALGGIGSVQAN